MENANSKEYLEKIKSQVIENLQRTAFAPSVQMTDVPRDLKGLDDEADAILDDLDEDRNQDTRYTKRRRDKFVEKVGELSDTEAEEEEESGHRRRPAIRPKRRNIMDHRNGAAPTDFDSGLDEPRPIGLGRIGGESRRGRLAASATPPPADDIVGGLVAAERPGLAAADPDGDIPMEGGADLASPIQAGPDVNNTQITPPLSPPTAPEASTWPTAPIPSTEDGEVVVDESTAAAPGGQPGEETLVDDQPEPTPSRGPSEQAPTSRG